MEPRHFRYVLSNVLQNALDETALPLEIQLTESPPGFMWLRISNRGTIDTVRLRARLHTREGLKRPITDDELPFLDHIGRSKNTDRSIGLGMGLFHSRYFVNLYDGKIALTQELRDNGESWVHAVIVLPLAQGAVRNTSLRQLLVSL